MDKVQSIFSNREIALGLWVILVAVVLGLSKAGKDFFRTSMPIIFCKKFVGFYIVFISFFILIVRILFLVGYWDWSLLKDTVFWALFVEIPLFIKTIEKAKNQRFFKKLLKENVELVTVVSFIMNIWSFSLFVEITLVPLAVIIGFFYYISSSDEKYKNIKRFFDFLLFAFTIYAGIYVINNIVQNSTVFFNLNTLRLYALPLVLLIFNLPVIYGLALYNEYEQVFVRLKGNEFEQRKMKWRILKYGNINLSKLTSIMNRNIQILVTSLTDEDMSENIKKLENYLESRVGDNYMNRARYYKLWSFIGIIVSIIGLMVCTTDVGIKDIVTFNFIFDIENAKKILTQIFIVGVVISIAAFIASIGFNKKKYEEISQIKRIAMHSFLYSLKYQNEVFQDFVPLQDPIDLFYLYIRPSYELKMGCDIVISSYDNLLTRWELECIQQLQLYAGVFLKDLHPNTTELISMSQEEFLRYYNQRIIDAPQNEKINTYTCDVQKNIDRYIEQVKLAIDEFKNCI
jgi:hypothetical protein